MNNRPNIVYILADDMGYGDVSCFNGDSKVRTEHLDRIAAGGVRCTDAHAASAVCTPSRYSILTGRYNWRSWLKRGVTHGYDRPLIEPGRMTVASLLGDSGYRTACVGKWHLGWNWPTRGDDPADVDYSQPITGGPTDLGFEEFFGIAASLDMPPYVYIDGDRPTALPDREVPGQAEKGFYRAGPIAPDFDHEQVLPRFADRADDFIRRCGQAGRPFFLYLPLSAPHTPILPTEEFRGRSGVSDYADFCLQVDAICGRLDRTLDELGLAENTLFVFTADNGCSPAADFAELHAAGHYPSYHFRGHKADIYEGGHRVPLIVRWPVALPAGTACGQTLCLGDLLATAAELVDADLPDNAGEDSVSSLPAWRGEAVEPVREATVHHSIDGSFSIRRGRWKLEMCAGSGGWSPPKPGAECEGLPPIQLYDLEGDVGERANVQDKHPEVVAELRELLARYIRDGRSTPGEPQENTNAPDWPGLWWLEEAGP